MKDRYLTTILKLNAQDNNVSFRFLFIEDKISSKLSDIKVFSTQAHMKYSYYYPFPAVVALGSTEPVSTLVLTSTVIVTSLTYGGHHRNLQKDYIHSLSVKRKEKLFPKGE